MRIKNVLQHKVIKEAFCFFTATHARTVVLKVWVCANSIVQKALKITGRWRQKRPEMQNKTQQQVVLESYEYLYHVTKVCNWEKIQASGLDPAESYRLNGDMYSTTSFKNHGFNCFVTLQHLHSVLRMMDDGMGDGLDDRVILRIPATVVANRAFELDRTQVTINSALKGIDAPTAAQFTTLLEEVGYLVCFDLIPPEHVEFFANAAAFGV